MYSSHDKVIFTKLGNSLQGSDVLGSAAGRAQTWKTTCFGNSQTFYGRPIEDLSLLVVSLVTKIGW